MDIIKGVLILTILLGPLILAIYRDEKNSGSSRFTALIYLFSAIEMAIVALYITFVYEEGTSIRQAVKSDYPGTYYRTWTVQYFPTWIPATLFSLISLRALLRGAYLLVRGPMFKRILLKLHGIVAGVLVAFLILYVIFYVC